MAGSANYYLKDQLGSVTALINASGAVSAQCSYDPYGNRSVLSGATSDIGYAGYFFHATTGLNFTLNRGYDAMHARWLNRDPISEAGGINLYAYVGANPINQLDFSGLCSIQIAPGPDPYPAINDPNFFSVNSFTDDGGVPATPGDPTQSDQFGPWNFFLDGLVAGAAGGGAGGMGLGIGAGEGVAFVAEGGTEAVASIVTIDAIANIGVLGIGSGAAAGGIAGLALFGLYEMTQILLSPNGQGYGYPYGSFPPF